MNKPMTEIVDLLPGTHIRQAAELLCRAAVEHGYAMATFNGIELKVKSGDEPAKVVADWVAQTEQQSKAYRESPEGIAEEAALQQQRREMQAKADALTEALPSIDWNDDVAVLDWCCEMQAPSDQRGVVIKRETILAEFARHGFEPNMRTGKDYDDTSRMVVHAYLVGQALDGLKRIAIHGMLHDFAAKWKARFVIGAAT